MTEPQLRVGIAGYGVVGKRRRHFIDIHPNLRTVAVSDITFGGDGHLEDGIPYFDDYRKLIDQKLDALFVCLPNNIAPDATIMGLENGIHTFCEKPPGRTVSDIMRVISAEQRNSRPKLKYGFNHRYHYSVRDALSIVRTGELGRVLNLRGVYGKSKFVSFGMHSDWRTDRKTAGGGILLDQGIHMVDLMRLFAGEFCDVHSFVSNDHWQHDVEDNAYALMRTKSGIVAILHSSATQWRHTFQLDITLAAGSIALSGILSGSKSYGAETMTVAYASEDDQGDPREVTTRYESDPSWADEIAEFANAILGSGSIDNGSSHDALATMQLVERIYCADPDWRERWHIGSAARN